MRNFILEFPVSQRSNVPHAAFYNPITAYRTIKVHFSKCVYVRVCVCFQDPGSCTMLARHWCRVHRVGQSEFNCNVLNVLSPSHTPTQLPLFCLSCQNCHELEKMDLEECILVRQHIDSNNIDCISSTFCLFVIVVKRNCLFLFASWPEDLRWKLAYVLILAILNHV